MKNWKHFLTGLTCFWLGLFALKSTALENATLALGVGGYDLVSYHTQTTPSKGNPTHSVIHNGITYLFSSKKNLNTFDKNKEKYLPAYGGYCAFGVANGKKFIGAPEIYDVVKGKLYLNLNQDVQNMWKPKSKELIDQANIQWKEIKHVSATEL